MKRPENQSGFSAIAGLLVVLAIVVISGAGWLVYQHNRPKVTNAAAGSTQSTTQPTTTTTTTQPAPTVSYLTIKEWGVKLPLSSAINDAYYAPSIGAAKGTDGQPNEFLLGLKSLDSSNCAATNTTGTAMIFRFMPTETDGVTGKPLTQLYPDAVKIGSYYYAYEKLNNGTCKAPQSTLQSVDSAFTTAQKGIAPSTN